MGVGGHRHTPAALPQVKRQFAHFTGGWMGPRAGLDECVKRRPHHVSIYQTPMPVVSRSADYVIPAHHHEEGKHFNQDMTLVSLLEQLELQVFPTFRKFLRGVIDK